MIVQIIGLPGSGKTTLANELVKIFNAVHLNADKVREFVNYDLGFSHEDRIENARRLGGVARLLDHQGLNVVVDFVCPTFETRLAFGEPHILVWVDRIKVGRYEDTNTLWQDPICFKGVHIVDGLTVEEEVNLVLERVKA